MASGRSRAAGFSRNSREATIHVGTTALIQASRNETNVTHGTELTEGMVKPLAVGVLHDERKYVCSGQHTDDGSNGRSRETVDREFEHHIAVRITEGFQRAEFVLSTMRPHGAVKVTSAATKYRKIGKDVRQFADDVNNDHVDAVALRGEPFTPAADRVCGER